MVMVFKAVVFRKLFKLSRRNTIMKSLNVLYLSMGVFVLANLISSPGAAGTDTASNGKTETFQTTADDISVKSMDSPKDKSGAVSATDGKKMVNQMPQGHSSHGKIEWLDKSTNRMVRGKQLGGLLQEILQDNGIPAANITIDSSISETVSGDFRGKNLQEAFESLVDEFGLVYYYNDTDRSIKIFNRSFESNTEHDVCKKDDALFLSLKNITVSDFEHVLLGHNLLTSEISRVQLGSRNVSYRGPSDLLALIKKLASEMDQRGVDLTHEKTQ